MKQSNETKNNISSPPALEITPVRASDYGLMVSSKKENSGKRANVLKAVHFDRPDYIPMIFHINESSWDCYPHDFLNEMIDTHPLLFDKTERSKGRMELDYRIIERVGQPFTDGWGCVWETTINGIVGTVTSHPLGNWDNFENYKAPEPDIDSGKGPVNWIKVKEAIDYCKRTGNLAIGGLRHGHTFQTLIDIRGYENLIMDMYDNDIRLVKLIDMVEEFNFAIVEKYIQAGAEWMSYAEDLGMQVGQLISPDLFLKFIKPSYSRLIKPARQNNCIIHMHSDGDIRNLAEHIIESGVHALNLQDLVNGVDWIKENLAGKVCIDLDIDRQNITPNGTPEQIDALIREEVEKLGSREGGFMMIYGLYPGVPTENIKALMDAMEHYAFYYSA